MFCQVRRLVLVESTALFDTAGIDLKAHKAVKVKSKGTHTHAYTLTILKQTYTDGRSPEGQTKRHTYK